MSTWRTRFWGVARRPRWIGALVLALGIAAAFAALGQWQLERSVENTAVVDIDTEAAVPLADIAEPGSGVTEAQYGRIVTISGRLVAGDAAVVTDRSDGTSRTGAWLVGRLRTDAGDSVVVALGWAPDAAAARAADPGDLAIEVAGRYLPSEEPQSSDFEAGERSTVSVAELLNRWSDGGPVYGGYVVAADAVAGLEPIRAPAPEREVTLNLLNLLYAIEWVVFAGFAVYLWYRLVRDAVERELDGEAEIVGATAPGAASPRP